MRNFLVVGKSRRVVAAVLQAVRSHGDDKCIVIGGEDTGPLRWSSLCERYAMIAFDGRDDARFVDIVEELAKQMPQLTMIPCDCDGIRLVNRVRERVSMPISPIPDTPQLDRFDDKWQFHRFCKQHALPVPSTLRIGSKHDADFKALATTFGLPFVLKPVNQAGSLGVKIVTNEAHFNSGILHNEQYQFAPLIAQRFVDGEDIDLSLLSVNGRLRAFAIQQVVGAEIHFVRNHQLEQIAHELCRVSGFHGVMHVDARIDKTTGAIYLIESNPRFWASLTASAWCGLNFVAESLHEHRSIPNVARLTAGIAHLRHPLLRPTCWRELLTATSERGRLLRAMTFDWPALSELLSELPMMCRRHMQKLKGDATKAWRSLDRLTARARKVP